jgi:hypothetical protein
VPAGQTHVFLGVGEGRSFFVYDRRLNYVAYSRQTKIADAQTVQMLDCDAALLGGVSGSL